MTLPGAFIVVLRGGGTLLGVGAAQILVLIGLVAGLAITAAALLRPAATRVVRNDVVEVYPR